LGGRRSPNSPNTGLQFDFGAEIEVDADGNTYVSGRTVSDKFPVSENAFQKSLRGQSDVFLTQLHSNGSLGFSTYLGGAGTEGEAALTVGRDGSVYLTGSTNSLDFPTTPGAYRREITRSDLWYAFVIKIDPRTPAIIYSTFIDLVIPPGDLWYVHSHPSDLV